MKKKLLIWSDAPVINTGFGEVARNLFRDLHKEYNVDIVGINYFGYQKYDTKSWYIYPVQQTDMFGINVVKYVLSKNHYDKFFMFQDIFNISKYLPQFRKTGGLKDTKIYTYFPIDGGQLHSGWKNFLEDGSITNITYTQFALNMIHESYPTLDISNIKYLYHGVANEFKYINSKYRNFLRDDYGWSDKFIAINVNRYQPRKNISATIRIWSMFSKGYKECECGHIYPKHLNFCDANRCDKSKVVNITEGHEDVGLYLHMNSSERVNGDREVNSLQSLALRSGFIDKDITNMKLMISSDNLYQNPKTTLQMNELYNAADINISTTLGEGVGLSLIESAATGTTSLAPRNSAILEMIGDHSILIDNAINGMVAQPFDNSFTRPTVNTKKFVKELENQYKLWKENGSKKIINKKAIDVTEKLFKWEDKREILHDILKNS